MSDISAEALELIEAARCARDNAHAPYSNFKVGGALRSKDGTIVTGVNFENCSYGLTVCAERNVLATAVGQGVRGEDIVEVAVVVEAEEAASPCGACRQVMAELLSLDTPVILHNLRHSQTVSVTLGELLPRAFLPATLKSALNPQGD